MKNILNYDLFIFDFDGTIFDTEHIHFRTWIETLENYIDVSKININTYFKYYHTLEKYKFKEYLNDNYNINSDKYDILYKEKCELYIEKIKVIDVNLINKIDLFLNFLKENKKKIILVTNASNKFIEIYKNKYEIMKMFDEIYTKEDFKKKKPDPECYLNVAHKYPNLKKICFEDSLTGFHSLSQVDNIDKVLINNNSYYYYDYIIDNYNNFKIIENYDIENLNNILN